MHRGVYGKEIDMSGYDIKVYDPKRLTGDDAKVMERGGWGDDGVVEKAVGSHG